MAKKRSSRVTAAGLESAAKQKPAVAKQPLSQSPGDLALPGISEEPTKPDETWRRIAVARAPAFDQAVPAYLLDNNYFFLDWNVAFDELVAKPLKLHRRSSHCGDFIRTLVGWEKVWERSRNVFSPENVPLVDFEPLTFKTEKYGIVEFEKIAVQIPDSEAQLIAWSVYLNIRSAEREEQLWSDLQTRLDVEMNWSRYAVSYDKLLLHFDNYGEMVSELVRRLSGCERVLDLGSGTGNGTLELLRGQANREVWAIDLNHVMMQQLIDKVELAQVKDRCDYFRRLRPIKEDVMRLNDLPDGDFDGVLSINLLYAVDRPDECIAKVGDLLRSGGKFVFSTSHRDTDVKVLFDRMEQVLRKKGLFDELENNFRDAYKRHLKMKNLINRDSKEDIRRWVENSGFDIIEWNESEYLGAVVVITAIKR